jgi:hypothetical protein
MADNTARARKELDSQRKTVRDHQQKWREHKEPYEKNFALKTIRNAQSHIAKIKRDHPSLARNDAPEDAWSP